MENAGAYAEIGRRAGVYYEENASLAPHCSFGTGGNADVLFFPETKERAEELIARLDEKGLCYVLLDIFRTRSGIHRDHHNRVGLDVRKEVDRQFCQGEKTQNYHRYKA